MKKNSVFLKAAGKAVGLPAVLLIFGLLLALGSCDQGCNRDGSCYTRTDGQTSNCADEDCAALKASNRNNVGSPSSATCDC